MRADAICLAALRHIKPDMSVSVVAVPHLLLQTKATEAVDIIVGFATLANCCEIPIALIDDRAGF